MTADGAPKLTTGRDAVELARAIWLFKCFSQELGTLTWTHLSFQRKQYWINCAKAIPHLDALDAQRGSVEATEEEIEAALSPTFFTRDVIERLARANLRIVKDGK